MSWFTFEDLKAVYPYAKVQQADDVYVNSVLIPDAVRFVQGAVAQTYDTPPADILGIARNYAVNKILGEDENVRIARARGQSSFTVAGDTVTIDLSTNPFLSQEDKSIIEDIRNGKDTQIHTDKVVVRTSGTDYKNPMGPTEYTRDRPTYFNK